MNLSISLNKNGYEPFIDFIKAFAILSVLWGHTFPYLQQTGYHLVFGMQVPLFILVQVFHVLKKDSCKLNFMKIVKRIFLPFLIIQFFALLFALFIKNEDSNFYINLVKAGGVGPGSYYPWLYLQLAVILWLVHPLFKTKSKTHLLIFSLIVSIAFEIFFSLIDLPDIIYRLLPFRYLFLIFLGWLWVDDGIVINIKTIILSIVSMVTIIYFEYFYMPTEPWFYDTTGWATHRWPCFFYVSTLLSGVLYYLYSKVKHINWMFDGVKSLAKCSYEIFLLQMVIIPFFPKMEFISNEIIRFGVRFFFIWLLSISGGYFYNMIYNRMLKRY